MPDTPGVRLNPPYLYGTLLAVNAISDAYFLGDGPDCIRSKGEQIHGRHDLFSTLMSSRGEHRVHYTGLTVFNIARNLESEIAAGLERIASRPACGAVFMGSMPMCTIAGTDYARIVREVFADGRKPAFALPSQAGLCGDWLDGYGAVLEAVAAGMDLAPAAPRAENVAVVGHLMGRNEGDHKGNVRELERILRALGLEPVSIWLSGGDYESLRAARRAGAVIAFGHGRKAAAILGKRLGVKVVDAELPFGLAATKRFVESLGREFGRQEAAEAFLRRELDEAVPALEWVVPHAFLGRRFAFAGDPHYACAFAEMIEELGGELAGMILLGGSRHLSAADRSALEARPRTLFEPMQSGLGPGWLGLERRDADLLVGTTMAIEYLKPRTSWLEFGYPSDYTHFLRDEPFLGFRGAVGFCSRLANEVTRGFCQDWLTPRERRREAPR